MLDSVGASAGRNGGRDREIQNWSRFDASGRPPRSAGFQSVLFLLIQMDPSQQSLIFFLFRSLGGFCFSAPDYDFVDADALGSAGLELPDSLFGFLNSEDPGLDLGGASEQSEPAPPPAPQPTTNLLSGLPGSCLPSSSFSSSLNGSFRSHLAECALMFLSDHPQKSLNQLTCTLHPSTSVSNHLNTRLSLLRLLQMRLLCLRQQLRPQPEQKRLQKGLSLKLRPTLLPPLRTLLVRRRKKERKKENLHRTKHGPG